MNKREHEPVLLAEAVNALAIQKEGIYIDGTFGRGGHSTAIVQQLARTGHLLVIDKDPDAIKAATELAVKYPQLLIEQGTFADIGQFVAVHHWAEKIDGILLDLGISSPQIDKAERGFSFMKEGPLDMRMDPSHGQNAADWINSAREEDLADVFWRYGEERFSRRIAKAIVSIRAKEPIMDTKQLADIVAKAHPKWDKHKHPATRCFQAIRIYINNELKDLERGLEESLKVLRTGGRLAVITFHSLEEQMVKRFIRHSTHGQEMPRDLPIQANFFSKKLKCLGKAVKPTLDEIKINPRSRSSKLWIMEKL